MKVVILCGGFGTRIRNVDENLPKPMIPVGRFPILWHIMKYYAHWGHNEFILCLGFRSDAIRQFFIDYKYHSGDITIAFGEDADITFHDRHDISDWRITLAETGLDTLTGSRVAKIRKYVGGEDFLLTYGDGLSDIDLEALVGFHNRHGRIMTVSGVRPPARFGEIEVDESGLVREFNEKPQATGGRISGGFFVCNNQVFDYLSESENQMLEQEPMNRLVEDGQLMMYKHDGFWQCMDTPRDHRLLSGLEEQGAAPWRLW